MARDKITDLGNDAIYHIVLFIILFIAVYVANTISSVLNVPQQFNLFNYIVSQIPIIMGILGAILIIYLVIVFILWLASHLGSNQILSP